MQRLELCVRDCGLEEAGHVRAVGERQEVIEQARQEVRW